MTINHRDVLTPANLLSTLGFGLVVYGSLTITSLSGVLAIGAGRVLDLLDGHIARRTHSSQFGAAVDASFDKLAVLIIIIACIAYGVVPWPVLLWVVVQNSANSVLAFTAKLKGKTITPNVDGKHTMFLQNISIGLFLLAHHSGIILIQNILFVAGSLSAIASLPLGIRATAQYATRIRPHKDGQ